jgi:hypothetical protein
LGGVFWSFLKIDINMVINIIPFWQGLVGLLGFGFFLFVFFLLFLVYIFFAVNARKTPQFKTELFRAWLLGLVFLWITILALPTFFQFTKVIINPNGSWQLKNGLGFTIHTFAPDEPRRVEMFTRKVFLSGNSARSFKNANLYILTDKKIYRSWTGIDHVIQKSADQIFDIIYATSPGIVVSQNKTSPVLFEAWLQRAKYGIYGLLGISLLASWIVDKIWKKEKK